MSPPHPSSLAAPSVARGHRLRGLACGLALAAGWAAALTPRPAAGFGGNVHLHSFARAKRELRKIYAAHPQPTTLYSGCVWDPSSGRVVARACTYQPRQPQGRGGRIEWEHIVPAAAFGARAPAWRKGHPRCRHKGGRPYRGRACASRVDAAFRRMESDMHNLVPEIGEVNLLRGNQDMGQVGGRYVQPGGIALRCGGRVCEPPPQVVGDVARAYLYMDAAYPELQLLTPEQRALFARWSAQDPPDAWECERQAQVARVQGNINSFVLAACPPAA